MCEPTGGQFIFKMRGLILLLFGTVVVATDNPPPSTVQITSTDKGVASPMENDKGFNNTTNSSTVILLSKDLEDPQLNGTVTSFENSDGFPPKPVDNDDTQRIGVVTPVENSAGFPPKPADKEDTQGKTEE